MEPVSRERRIAQTMLALREVSELAQGCGLTIDEVMLLLRRQWDDAIERSERVSGASPK